MKIPFRFVEGGCGAVNLFVDFPFFSYGQNLEQLKSTKKQLCSLFRCTNLQQKIDDFLHSTIMFGAKSTIYIYPPSPPCTTYQEGNKGHPREVTAVKINKLLKNKHFRDVACGY